MSYAIQTHRLNPQNLEYTNLETLGFIDAMEEMDHLADVFAQLPKYRSPLSTKDFLEKLLASDSMDIIRAEG